MSTSEEIKTETTDNFITNGLSGIVNMGNTCYLASTIQLLSNCRFLNSILMNSNIIKNISNKIIYDLKHQTTNEEKAQFDKEKLINKIEETITYQLYKVIKTMWDKNRLVRPRSLKSVIGKHPTLAGFGQQDAQEALQFILDHLHTETSTVIKSILFVDKIAETINIQIDKIKELSSIIDNDSVPLEHKQSASDNLMKLYEEDNQKYLLMMFVLQWKQFVKKEGISDFSYLLWGVTCTKRTCKQCGFMSPKFEMFNMIQLTIPKDETNLDIYDCFKHHFIKQDIEYKCSRCSKKDAEEESYIYIYPETMFIQLKRFEHQYNPVMQRLESNKISKKINFPILNLEFTENSIATECKETKIYYNLKGIIEHRGNINYGHYVAYCENTVSPTGEWFEFNDDDVIRIPKDELEKEIITSNTYILMYQKHNQFIEENEHPTVSSYTEFYDDDIL